MDGVKLFTDSGESLLVKETGIPDAENRLFDGKLLYKSVKRMLDIIISAMGLILLSPVFIGTAAAIALEDGAPIFYMQKRIGKNEREFKIYKFRSMYRNAEEIHEELREEYGCKEISFKPKDDPRITKVGKVIRKFNIDELPQLINILKGDMSLVGPRPLPVYEYRDERKYYGSKYIERYAVPQGLTCIWQISDRASVDFETRMQMDVNYARKSGFWIDIGLIIRTFIFTIRGKAAY